MSDVKVIVPQSWFGFVEQLKPLVPDGIEIIFGCSATSIESAVVGSHLGLCCETIKDLNPLQILDQVKVVSFCGTGIFDLLDLPILKNKELSICNIRDYASVEVAEFALALILGISKRICIGDNLVRSGQWSTPGPWGVTLRGKTLGLLGLGAIGREVARMARMLGMKVIYWSRKSHPDVEYELGIKFVKLEDLFSTSDVISLHLALNEDTRGIVDRLLLQRLSAGTVLINTARGALIDQDALLEALISGSLAGAALDVFEDEPLPSGHLLTTLDNVILSPHVASSTPEAIMRSRAECLQNIVSFFGGEPRNVVRS